MPTITKRKPRRKPAQLLGQQLSRNGEGKLVNVLFVRNVPAHLQDQFKAECALCRVSMRDVTIQMMRMFCNLRLQTGHTPEAHDETKRARKIRQKLLAAGDGELG